ncbi:hypothetical protein FI667_g5998, partial [Globisporangium splendens]
MYSSRDDKVHPTLERSDRIGTREDTSLPSSSQYQSSNYPPQGGNPRDDYGTHGRQHGRTWGEKAKEMVGMEPHSHGTTGSYDNSGYGTNANTSTSYGTTTTNQGGSSFQPDHETRSDLHGHNTTGGQYSDNDAYGARQDDRTMGEKAKDMVGMGPHSYGTTGSCDNTGYSSNANTGTSYGTNLGGHHTTSNQYGDNSSYGHRQDDRTLGEKAKDTVGMGPHSHGTTGSYNTSPNDQYTSPYSGTISIGDNPSGIDNHSNTSTAGSSGIGSSSNTSSLGSTTTNPSGDSSGSHGTRTINDTYEHHGAGTTMNPSTSATGTHARTTATNDTNNREHKSFMTSMIDKAKHLVGKGHDNDPAHHHQGRDTAHDNDPNKFGTHNNDYDNDRNKHGKHKGHSKYEEANENNLFEPSLTNQ